MVAVDTCLRWAWVSTETFTSTLLIYSYLIKAMSMAALTLAALLCATLTISSAAALPYVDSVIFYRVDSAEHALKLMDEGLLDMYYHTVPLHLLEGADNLDVYTNPDGGSISILLNPAEVDEFNPFSITEVRFAVHYLIDREDIVSQLLDGYGSPLISPYAPFDPDYTRILEQIASFGIQYNPAAAKAIIDTAMTEAGATMKKDVWVMDGEPVTIKLFIRDDDPIRLSIGDTLASNLEDMGFVVERMYGDLAEAYSLVYSSNPADLGWHAYTEGWGASFSRYDDSSLAGFYAPWLANMPGAQNPEFWSYEHERLDEVTIALYNGEYGGEDERTQLLREALTLGVQEAVRVFVVVPYDTFVVNKNVEGVINSVGGGITNPLTLNNAQLDDILLRVGMRHLGQSAWNPVAGYSDVYSNHIVEPLLDPSAISHPYTSDVIPVRVERSIDTAGPDGKLVVPSDAITWDPLTQRWTPVGPGTTATSAVKMDYTFSNWHHGPAIDMQDILFGVYFMYEWGTESGPLDSTIDSEYTTTVAPFLEDIFVAIRQLDDDTLEVYVNYWHFDEDEIGATATRWTSTPWELFFTMEQIVKDGKAAFSSAESTAKEVPWLSVIDADDIDLIRQYLEQSADYNIVPKAISGLETSYYTDRYMASIEWINQYDHAQIGHGSFYLSSYDDERGISFIREFRDDSYPYMVGKWSHFTEPLYPDVTGVEFNDIIPSDESFTIDVHSTGTDRLRYFLTHEGEIVHTDEIMSMGTDRLTIQLDGQWGCPTSLLLFAISDDVIIPDVYTADVVSGACSHPTINDTLLGLAESERTTLLTVMVYLLDGNIDGIPTSVLDDISENPKLYHALLTMLSLALDDHISFTDIDKLIFGDE
ncbi:MAG: ABC transporter substrate-binding protein [Cenarchaeum sp. SB0665_bin_23]|nr:ABC transporter substrate-binding protein [Cenarchaeum sp. SB0665_bin_23]MYG33448.1 ABC transporter substrate-binding protein [Cenarchaeum sp. SB0677_bin_16]